MPEHQTRGSSGICLISLGCGLGEATERNCLLFGSNGGFIPPPTLKRPQLRTVPAKTFEVLHVGNGQVPTLRAYEPAGRIGRHRLKPVANNAVWATDYWLRHRRLHWHLRGGREIFAAETSPRPTLIHAPFLRCSAEMALEKRRNYTARTRRV